jgi:tetratricopeptide (TPR) repeat protein
MSGSGSRPFEVRGRLLALIAAGVLSCLRVTQAHSEPYLPANDERVLAELPAGVRFSEVAARHLAQSRADVALPLAQFYLQQSRQSGDLRYLGYADAVLAPWIKREPPNPAALVLEATVQQSRHQFDAALETLARALRANPADAQAMLTQATVLRVLGRYTEAQAACERFASRVSSQLGSVCIQGVRALTGHLESAYETLSAVTTQGWLPAERSWLYSELGEMAVRLGRDTEAEHWFQADLALAPADFYVRGAYADLLLRDGRAAETMRLLEGYDSFEPLLLRIAIAEQQLHAPALDASRARLDAAFAAELERGEAVHRREQARFLLEIEHQPPQALRAAQADWRVQREPADAQVFVAAAEAAGQAAAATAARDVLRQAGPQAPAALSP